MSKRTTIKELKAMTKDQLSTLVIDVRAAANSMAEHDIYTDVKADKLTKDQLIVACMQAREVCDVLTMMAKHDAPRMQYIVDLEAAAAEYECTLWWLEERLSTQPKVKPEGRKAQVLKILQSGHVTVDAIAQRIGISARNVSSQMTYLRADGYAIATDSLGRKFLE